jgi:hypothetical protein
VDFEVESGPNKGTSGKATTDKAGEASFSYTGGPSSGTDTVVASFVDSLKNKHTSNTVEVIWEAETDAPLTSECAVPATTVQAFAGPTATFTDADPGGMSSDYSAQIEWGDGTESPGAISAGTGPGPYTVSGSHAYGSTGTFTITTTIKDAGGSKTVARCRTLVFALAPGGGSFVIGDENSATGTAVTFWGAKWWKNNSLSGGGAPPSFKGFAEKPATSSCGAGWGADPGNSTPPPNGPVPADMGVIVSSKVTKSGSQISGDTVHIVIVKTNPGYQSNPGHAGTGTVEAQVC